jgi:hypothetical protein
MSRKNTNRWQISNGVGAVVKRIADRLDLL